MPKFSILITTRNRLEDLKITLHKSQSFLGNDEVEWIICDDGSIDGTAHFLSTNYPNIQLIQNEKSQGLIYSRNKLLNLSTADFAISLDDDAHFLTENPLALTENYFNQNPNCGLIAARIFWGINEPKSTASNQNSERVQSFVGCAHVWQMSAWRKIPNYPAWFVFYGEEDFAAYQLFKQNIEIHYVPELLVHHRVDIKARKNNNDFRLRTRRSLRSGWYLMLLFFPMSKIPKAFLYSIYSQLKNKVFKGDFKTLLTLFLVLYDVVLNATNIYKNINRYSIKEFQDYKALPKTKIYWTFESTN